MNTKIESTYWAKIYLSGPIAVIEQTCRQECLEAGLCVTVEPTKFIYTGGEENGAVVGLINYPRFPTSKDDLWHRATELAIRLLNATCQHSVLVMSPDITEWITKRVNCRTHEKDASVACGLCGNQLEEVRPGKHQCPKCESEPIE